MSFAAVILLTLIFGSADDLTLSINIIDSMGKAVPQAVVSVENTTAQKRWTGITADSGTCRFERLATGSYKIEIAKEGYYAGSFEVSLEASKVIDFSLIPVENRHDEVDVIARPEPINVEAISAEQTVNDEVIQSLPYKGRLDFQSALSLMPGVVRDNTGGMHIQGSRSDQVRYQLDGLNVTDPSGGLTSNIPIDAIEAVNLDMAGYSAEYGKGSGGVVRVESKFVGDKVKWNLTDFFPGLNFRRKTIGELSPRFLLSGPLVHNKAWFMYSGMLRYIRTFNEALPEGQNRQNQTDGSQLVKLQWNLAESHVLTMTVLNGDQYFGNEGLSPQRPLETTTNFLQRGTTAAVSNRSILKTILLDTTLLWSHRRDSDLAKGTDRLIVRPKGWSGNYYTDRRGRMDRYHAGQNVAFERKYRGIVHRFKAGGEFDYVNSDLTLHRRTFEIRDSADRLESLVRFDGPDSAEIRNRETGFFAQDRMILTPKVQFEAGVRGDRESVVGPLNFAPRAAVSYLPFGNGRSKISAGFGLFYDNVTLDHFQLAEMQHRVSIAYDPKGIASPFATPTAVLIAPGLHSPYGVNWNAEWHHEWAPRWVTRINFIQKRGHDQVRLAAVPAPRGFNLQFNSSGKSTYNAVEFSIDRPIRTNLRILASYIYSQARERPSLSIDFPDPSLEKLGLAPAAWNTPHRFVTWGYFPFFLKMAASYATEVRSGFPYSAVDPFNRLIGGYNQRNMPVYFSTNASLEKEVPIVFGKRMAIRLGVTNLFNRFNPRFVDTTLGSPTFLHFSDSSPRAFVGRVRLIKKS